MSASTSPPVSAANLAWRRWLSSMVRRPLRAADAVRFMSSDEGGVAKVTTGDFFFGAALARFGAALTRVAGRFVGRVAARLGDFFAGRLAIGRFRPFVFVFVRLVSLLGVVKRDGGFHFAAQNWHGWPLLECEVPVTEAPSRRQWFNMARTQLRLAALPHPRPFPRWGKGDFEIGRRGVYEFFGCTTAQSSK